MENPQDLFTNIAFELRQPYESVNFMLEIYTASGTFDLTKTQFSVGYNQATHHTTMQVKLFEASTQGGGNIMVHAGLRTDEFSTTADGKVHPNAELQVNITVIQNVARQNTKSRLLRDAEKVEDEF